MSGDPRIRRNSMLSDFNRSISVPGNLNSMLPATQNAQTEGITKPSASILNRNPLFQSKPPKFEPLGKPIAKSIYEGTISSSTGFSGPGTKAAAAAARRKEAEAKQKTLEDGLKVSEHEINLFKNELNHLENELQKIGSRTKRYEEEEVDEKADLNLSVSADEISKMRATQIIKLKEKRYQKLGKPRPKYEWQKILYENKKTAKESHKKLVSLGPLYQIPKYTQPADIPNIQNILLENQRKMKYLVPFLAKRKRADYKRKKYLTMNYREEQAQYMAQIKSYEKTAKERMTQVTRFWEKFFPEVRRQRENNEKDNRMRRLAFDWSDAWAKNQDKIKRPKLDDDEMNGFENNVDSTTEHVINLDANDNCATEKNNIEDPTKSILAISKPDHFMDTGQNTPIQPSEASEVMNHEKDLQLNLSIRKNAIIPTELEDLTKRSQSIRNLNHRVEDPKSLYKKYTNLDKWTERERGIFRDVYAGAPKNFPEITKQLSPWKKSQDCVLFYYLTKKPLGSGQSANQLNTYKALLKKNHQAKLKQKLIEKKMTRSRAINKDEAENVGYGISLRNSVHNQVNVPFGGESDMNGHNISTNIFSGHNIIPNQPSQNIPVSINSGSNQAPNFYQQVYLANSAPKSENASSLKPENTSKPDLQSESNKPEAKSEKQYDHTLQVDCPTVKPTTTPENEKKSDNSLENTLNAAGQDMFLNKLGETCKNTVIDALKECLNEESNWIPEMENSGAKPQPNWVKLGKDLHRLPSQVEALAMAFKEEIPALQKAVEDDNTNEVFEDNDMETGEDGITENDQNGYLNVSKSEVKSETPSLPTTPGPVDSNHVTPVKTENCLAKPVIKIEATPQNQFSNQQFFSQQQTNPSRIKQQSPRSGSIQLQQLPLTIQTGNSQQQRLIQNQPSQYLLTIPQPSRSVNTPSSSKNDDMSIGSYGDNCLGLQTSKLTPPVSSMHLDGNSPVVQKSTRNPFSFNSGKVTNSGLKPSSLIGNQAGMGSSASSQKSPSAGYEDIQKPASIQKLHDKLNAKRGPTTTGKIYQVVQTQNIVLNQVGGLNGQMKVNDYPQIQVQNPRIQVQNSIQVQNPRIQLQAHQVQPQNQQIQVNQQNLAQNPNQQTQISQIQPQNLSQNQPQNQHPPSQNSQFQSQPAKKPSSAANDALLLLNFSGHSEEPNNNNSNNNSSSNTQKQENVVMQMSPIMNRNHQNPTITRQLPPKPPSRSVQIVGGGGNMSHHSRVTSHDSLSSNEMANFSSKIGQNQGVNQRINHANQNIGHVNQGVSQNMPISQGVQISQNMPISQNKQAQSVKPSGVHGSQLKLPGQQTNVASQSRHRGPQGISQGITQGISQGITQGIPPRSNSQSLIRNPNINQTQNQSLVQSQAQSQPQSQAQSQAKSQIKLQTHTKSSHPQHSRQIQNSQPQTKHQSQQNLAQTQNQFQTQNQQIQPQRCATSSGPIIIKKPSSHHGGNNKQSTCGSIGSNLSRNFDKYENSQQLHQAQQVQQNVKSSVKQQQQQQQPPRASSVHVGPSSDQGSVQQQAMQQQVVQQGGVQQHGFQYQTVQQGVQQQGLQQQGVQQQGVQQPGAQQQGIQQQGIQQQGVQQQYSKNSQNSYSIATLQPGHSFSIQSRKVDFWSPKLILFHIFDLLDHLKNLRLLRFGFKLVNDLLARSVL